MLMVSKDEGPGTAAAAGRRTTMAVVNTERAARAAGSAAARGQALVWQWCSATPACNSTATTSAGRGDTTSASDTSHKVRASQHTKLQKSSAHLHRVGMVHAPQNLNFAAEISQSNFVRALENLGCDQSAIPAHT